MPYGSINVVVFNSVQGEQLREWEHIWVPIQEQNIILVHRQLNLFISQHYPTAIRNLYYRLIMLSSKICCLFTSNKIYSCANKAIQGITHGSFLMVGGFGFCGVPMNLVNALRLAQLKNLTIATNSCGVDGLTLEDDWGLTMLLRTKQIKRLIFSHLGENTEAGRQYFNGEIQLEAVPQGTFSQKIRSGGAGIPAFYTPTGVGTIIETGGFIIKYKKTQNGLEPELLTKPQPLKVFNNRKFLQIESMFAEFALIKAWRADTHGNLEFHKTARNFNADMATAAKCVIAEVQQIVQPGMLDPEAIHVPSIYVDRIYKMDPESRYSQSVIERLTLQDHLQVKRKVRFSLLKSGSLVFDDHPSKLSKDELRYKIARRAAKQVCCGMSVNLGIGIPTLLPQVLPQGVDIHIQSQNGVLGVGHHPSLQQVDPDDINAGKETVTLLPGGSYFSSSQSFGMIRGGHLDVTMLGSFQVSQKGDIANWMIPGKVMKGMGGAMDLVSSGSRVIVLMQHSAVDKKGNRSLKLLQTCSIPLTGKGMVSMVITELAVFQNRDGGLVLTELSEGVTLEEVQLQTGFKIVCAQQIGRF